MNWLTDLFVWLFPPQRIEVKEIEALPIAPKPIEPMPTPLDFNKPKDAYIGTRRMCDDLGVSYTKNILVRYPQGGSGYHSFKDIICACIYQESGFLNYKAPGVPTKFQNKDKNGVVWSTDWGIVEVNDTEGWHIGPGLAFPSVQYVLDNPDRAVRYMIRMALAGQLSKWSSYKFNHYQQHLHPKSKMWLLGR